MLKKLILCIAISSTLVGCQSYNSLSTNQKTAVGAIGGALLGGVIGHQVNDKNGRYVGAVLGALAGGAIARYMDDQQKALEQALGSSGIGITRVDEKTIKLNLPNGITFPSNKYTLNPAIYGSLNQIASIVNKYNKTAIHVLGHADSDGSEQHNLTLSQNRAAAVGQYLASQGVVDGRIAARGYGESNPVATNSTAAGKAQNRRVEIFIRAIESGNEQAAYAPIY